MEGTWRYTFSTWFVMLHYTAYSARMSSENTHKIFSEELELAAQ